MGVIGAVRGGMLGGAIAWCRDASCCSCGCNIKHTPILGHASSAVAPPCFSIGAWRLHNTRCSYSGPFFGGRWQQQVAAHLELAQDAYAEQGTLAAGTAAQPA